MNTDNEIYLLIEKYFSGTTSLEEEARLRRLLARAGEDTPEIREAKAVMGFFAAAQRKSSAGFSPFRAILWRGISLAASVIIALVLCIGLFMSNPGDNTTEMIAYIGGVKTTDRATIINTIMDDFKSIREANMIIEDGIASDFEAINEAINF